MRRSQQLREAYRVPTPYEMHLKHGMALSPTMITKGRAAVEAKGPRVFVSRKGQGWAVEYRLGGERAQRVMSDRKKVVWETVVKVLGQLRNNGDSFVASDGRRTWRVTGGDTLALADAQRGLRAFFGRGE